MSFAKTPAIFALQDIELLSKLLNYKLFLITMTENKKSNGADFGLAFYAGALSGQFKPNKTKFYILSSDRDFEHIARLLQKKSFKVKQVTKEQYIMHKNIDNGLMPKLTEFKKNIYLHDIKHLCDIWTKENNNRPAKIKTLKKDIYQKLKLTDKSVDRIFELLQEYKIVHVNHTKIGYNQGHIKNWSALDTGDYQTDKMR